MGSPGFCMDTDLEFAEYRDYPCRICGCIDYRYYGGGYNCREGHRNDELREQVGEEDDFDFGRSQMRSTQLSMSKMTGQNARVTGKKFRKHSGKGDHDVNERYGVTEEIQAVLFEEERTRFVRKGDKKKHVIMEAAMQVLILQVEAVKNNFPELWMWINTSSNAEIEAKKKEFEGLARKLFQAYATELSFPYWHTDTKYPELTALAPPFQPSKYCNKSKRPQGPTFTSTNTATQEEASKHLMDDIDDLDKELMLDGYDYGDESSLSDSDHEDEDHHKNINDGIGGLLDTSTAARVKNTTTSSSSPTSCAAENFPRQRSKPLNNAFSYLNMTFLTHLALVHCGIPILFSDLAAGLESGKLPGYRPDFLLTKDIVTVRFNINELRAFHTRALPSTTHLFQDSRLMLELLGHRCKVPDWVLNERSTDQLIFRFINELSLPPEYFPYIKKHLQSIGPLSFSVLSMNANANGNVSYGVYVTPCVLVASAILFFLRLVYTLTGNDEDDSYDPTRINEKLRSQGLPIQSELLPIWRKKMNSKCLFAERERPVTDPDEYQQLLDLTNDLLVPTCILTNSSSSIKGIFGSTRVDEVLQQRSRSRSSSKKMLQSQSYKRIDLPMDNFMKYISYPDGVNPRSLPGPHRLLLGVFERLIGVPASTLEAVVKQIFEAQQSVDSFRIKNYELKRKMKPFIESDVYIYY